MSQKVPSQPISEKIDTEGMVDDSKTSGEKSEGTETSATNKRSRAEADEPPTEAEGISPDDFAKMSRSERKRHREKKRRSDVNKGFDELMTLLLEIDPSVRAEAEERARRGQWKGNFGAHEDNLLSRVDLIGRTVEVLRRVHRENEERKRIIASLTQSGGAARSTSADLGLLPFSGLGGLPAGQSLAAGAGRGQAAIASQGLARPGTDALALRAAAAAAAAAESSYNQTLLGHVAGAGNPNMFLPPTQEELLGLVHPGSALHAYPPAGIPGSLALSAAGAGALPAGFAAGRGSLMTAGNPSALTRQYLQLLQTRQDASQLSGRDPSELHFPGSKDPTDQE